MMHVLHYEYVDDILERRAPFRDAHLGAIQEWNQRGQLVLAGAVGDPPHGAMLIFRNTATDDIEAYANNDPYMTAGLISRWWIEPCTVVTPPPNDV
jgi:hypothetical protein